MRNGEDPVVARVSDVYSALPALTGKTRTRIRRRTEGRGNIARELVRGAVGRVFARYVADADFQNVIKWFEMGGELKVSDTVPPG